MKNENIKNQSDNTKYKNVWNKKWF